MIFQLLGACGCDFGERFFGGRARPTDRDNGQRRLNIVQSVVTLYYPYNAPYML